MEAHRSRALSRRSCRVISLAAPCACLLVLASAPALAQKKNGEYQLRIHRAPSPIVVDGSAHERAWESAEVAGNFWRVLPTDTGHATVRTEVRMAYDDHNLYLSAICHHSNIAGPYIVESLRRDWNFGNNDNFIFFLDTFNDLTNGYTFGVNAAGAEWDGLLYDGGKANLSWDNKWTSAVRTYEDRYELEIAIPFTTLRYKRGSAEWGVNFSRLDLKTAEKSSWTPIPRQFPTASLALTGNLLWDEAPPVHSNVSLIPYALGGFTRNYEAQLPLRTREDVGADAKVAIGPALNLDVTVNPDYSQVDVDQQVTNLDRFELFFPEKRQFFLENGDQFANFGYPTIRPFFSRRIGLDAVPILFGARLSGKLGKDWRLGVMDMQTGSVDQTSVPAANFYVAALQRRVFSRSNIGLLLVGKETAGFVGPGGISVQPSHYNRNLGVEYNLASAGNEWTGKLLYIKSLTSGANASGAVYAGNLQYNTRRWLLNGQFESVDPNYEAEAGYVPRRGYRRALANLGYTFLPESTRILSHGPVATATEFLDWSGRVSDYTASLGYMVTLRTQDVFTVSAGADSVRLLAPFDPTNSGREELPTGSLHRWNSWTTKFDSRPQALFRYGFSTIYGGYYARGKRTNITASAGYRFQPFVSISGTVSYDDLRLPQPWGHAGFWLAGPRFDVTLTNTLYFTTFIQYNDQQRNVNVNTRLQWRYRPASDLFLVWTDNYIPEYLQPGRDIPGLFSVRNRAVVLKCAYWWNF